MHAFRVFRGRNFPEDLPGVAHEMQVIRGHHGSALSHISSGVKILSEVQSSPVGRKSSGGLKVSSIPYVDLKEFEVIFNRLNSQGSQVCDCTRYMGTPN